jgi:hypothetical protein
MNPSTERNTRIREPVAVTTRPDSLNRLMESAPVDLVPPPLSR